MVKVMLVGDTHRNNGFLKGLIDIAIARDVETIIQLGDFAFNFQERQFFKNIARFTLGGRKFYFVPGNHDDWDFLDFICDDQGYGHDKPIKMSEFDQPKGHPAEPTTPFPNDLYFLPRSCIVKIGYRTCMAMGGAVSIDADMRVPHHSYWPTETIGQDDVYRAFDASDQAARDGIRIDTMLTHDVPADTYPFENQLESVGYKIDAISRRHRDTLAKIVNYVRPLHLYHGHYHRRHEGLYQAKAPETGLWVRTSVHGLGADVSGPPTQDLNYIIEEW